MADQNPGLQIDSDWKKQAQEEKKRLAEQAAKASPPPAGPAGAPAAAARAVPGAASMPGAAAGQRGQRQMPQASFSALVQSLMTQSLFYLGDLAPRGQQPVVDLDMAKHNIDLLGMLEEKTKNNLTDEEKKVLDGTLYELRMRYVNVASQYIM